MANEVVTIRVTNDDYVLKYLQVKTFNLLSKTQYKVLVEIIKNKVVDTEVRKLISAKLGITIFSLNNTLLTLKRKGLVIHNEASQTYTSRLEVPEEPDTLTFKFVYR